MVDLSSLLDDEDLRRRYGTPTLDRAWDYVRRGNVLSCTDELDSDGDLDIRGIVAGSTSAPYVVNLSVGEDPRGVWVFGRCSCPVGEGCKHALACLITVRDEHRQHAPQHGRRWERQLSSLLDELAQRAEGSRRPDTPPTRVGRGGRRLPRRPADPARGGEPSTRPEKPLALQVELRAPAGTRAW